jgi:transmembrane sensor
MEEQLTYYIDLISRYFSGEASPGEIQQLSTWVKENDDNRKIFDDYRKAWELHEIAVIENSTDLDAEWSSLTSRLHLHEKETKVVPIQAASPKKFGWMKLAAAFFLVLTSAAILYFFVANPGKVVVTADAGTLIETLPDGSVITLNKGATLEYPSRFADARNVTLKGEAYFEVAHDASKPFIVTCADAKVEVLGTKFNVSGSPDNGNVNVVLTSGKVSFYYSGDEKQKVILNPGEQAKLSATDHRIVKSQLTDPNYMAWKTQRIVFEDTRLSDIVSTLESVYHVRIVLSDPSTGNCRITATFDHQPINSVLNVLRNTLDMRVKNKDGVYIIEGRPCE